jgi:hypothetical protein
MLSKIGEKEEKQDSEHHDTGSGVVVLQQTNQLLVSSTPFDMSQADE